MDFEKNMIEALVLTSLIPMLPRRVSKKVIFQLLSTCDVKLSKEELTEMEEYFKPR